MKQVLWCLLISIMVLGSGSTATAGEIYKWVDKNGNLHFSDKKPPSKKRAQGDIDVIKFKSKVIPPKPEDLSDDLELFRGIKADPLRSDNFKALDRKVKWGLWNETNGSATAQNQSLLLKANGGTNIYQQIFTAPILFQYLDGINQFSEEVSIQYTSADPSNSTGIILFTKDMKSWLKFSFASKQTIGWKSHNQEGKFLDYASDETTLKLFHLEGKTHMYYRENNEWKLLDSVKGGSFNVIGLFAFSWVSADVAANFQNVVFTMPSHNGK